MQDEWMNDMDVGAISRRTFVCLDGRQSTSLISIRMGWIEKTEERSALGSNGPGRDGPSVLPLFLIWRQGGGEEGVGKKVKFHFSHAEWRTHTNTHEGLPTQTVGFGNDHVTKCNIKYVKEKKNVHHVFVDNVKIRNASISFVVLYLTVQHSAALLIVVVPYLPVTPLTRTMKDSCTCQS